MNNSLKPILSLSLVATLAFGLAACSKDVESSPTPSSSSSPSTTSQAPTAPPTSVATPSAKPSQSVATGTELEIAKKAFPNAEGEGKVTKEEVQLALASAQRYTNSIYNSGYLANGSWVKNGADSQELYKLFGRDWSDAYRLKLETLIDDFQKGSTEEKDKAANDLLTNFFFFDNSGGLQLPKDCNMNQVGVSSCLVNEKLESTTDMTYQVNKETGSIYVNAHFTANVRFVKGGVQGVSPVQYDVQLEMIKNPYPDEENLRYAYIVNDIGGNWKIDKWHEGDK